MATPEGIGAQSLRGLAASGSAALRGASSLAGRVLGKGGERRAEHVVTVNRAPDDVYGYWRGLQNLPVFMRHLDRVDVIDEHHSHWVARAPGGGTVEWDAEIVVDEPSRRIAWQSAPGADVDSEGEVTFTPAPGERGTEVRVRVGYRLPGGVVGEAVARVAGESPAEQTRDDLRRFKSVMETGEVLAIEGQPSGRTPLGRQLTAAVSRRLGTMGRG